MKSRGAPPPPGAAPAVSREIVNIVKKKLSAPSSAPPENMRSMVRPVKHERHDDNEDDDDVDDVNVGEIEEKINGKKYFSNSSQLDRSRSSENDKRRSMDRNSWDNDDRPDERQFQQPRRTPAGRMQNENDDEDDDEGSYDEYESDHSGLRRSGGRNNRQMTESLSKSRDRDRDEYPPSMYPPTRSEAKNSDRDRDDGRSLTSGSKGATPRPIKPATYNFQPLLKATYRELRSFVLSPCDPGVTTK